MAEETAKRILARKGRALGPGEEAFIRWFGKHGRKIDTQSWAIADASGDAEARYALQLLQLDVMLRKQGRRAIEKATRHHDVALRNQELRRLGLDPKMSGTLDDLYLEDGKHVRAERTKGLGLLGPRGLRSRSSQTVVTQARLTGQFALCPLCGLILYRRNRDLLAGHNWHRQCLNAWKRTRAVRAWHARRVALRRRGLDTSLLGDFPLPPAPPSLTGRPPEPAVLMASYRALLAHAAGASYAQLAAEVGITRAAIQQRVSALRSRLPASWRLVFGTTKKGLDTRQRVFPLPDRLDLNSPERRELANHLRSLSIPDEVIQEVVGVAPDDTTPTDS